MRIAISGSHSLGKSTVVNDWVASRAGYTREEEPYRALSLHGPYEILFRDASTRLHNGIQLYYNISRLHRYASGVEDVIFDRAPVDYLAYSQYTANCGTTDIDDAFVQSMVPAVRESLDHLDLLAFVPCSEQWPWRRTASVRSTIPTGTPWTPSSNKFTEEGRFGVMPEKNAPRLIELCGSREQRLEQLAATITELGTA
jgi:hypothetical protein